MLQREQMGDVAQYEAASIEESVGRRTILDRFLQTARTYAAANALHDSGRTLTFRSYERAVASVASGLSRLGVRRGDRVGLMFLNTLEFHIVDLAVTALGAVPVSIYNTSSPDQIAYIAGHAGLELILADSTMSGRVTDAVKRVNVFSIDCGSPQPLAELRGDPLDLDVLASELTNDSTATLIYTSGTTGPPKAVVLTHHNILWTIESVHRRIGNQDLSGSRLVSYLPTAHIAERIMSHYQQVAHGFEVTCCPNITHLFETIRSVQPTILFGVPRTWEKVATLLRGALLSLDMDPDNVYSSPNASITVEKLLATAGLGSLRFASSGAAPTAPSLIRWLRSLGIPLTQVYGLSETTGTIAWSPDAPANTVGAPLPGTQVKLAPDGEIFTRGGHVFSGYLGQLGASSGVDDDGWLATGDIGVIDDTGNLEIVDRKKDIIVTAGGKNISPANLESALMQIPTVEHAFVIGEGRPYVTALVTIDRNELRQWAVRSGAGVAEDSVIQNPKFREFVTSEVHRAMAVFNRAEAVRQVLVLEDSWLPGSELLTPTGKLRRRAAEWHYEDQIESLYKSSPPTRANGPH